MIRKLSVLSFTVLLALIWIGLFASDALAIPAFARKYGVNCNKCHTQIPQLNVDGIRFKQNGYRQPDEEGRVIWEEETFPLGALLKIRYNFTSSDKKGVKNKSFFDPHELEIFSAGTMGPKVSYFLEVEGEFETEEDEANVELGEFFIILDDLLGENSMVNVKAGRFINEYFHVSDHLKMTAEGYLSKNVSIDVDGIELDGLVPAGPGGAHYAVGVVNDETGIQSDDNNFRAFYGWTSYTVAGQTLGVRYIHSPTRAAPGLDHENHTQFDTFFKGTADLGLSETNPAYLIFGFATEDNVGGLDGKERLSYVVEPTVFLGEKWALIGRYELQNDPDVSDTNDRFLFHVGYHPIPNLKLFAEYHHKEIREGPNEIEDRFRFGFFVAF
ncbi:MAG: hypothetical protein ACE5IQ_14820 [Candidatus Methylomirabilales bacterium]